jgi:hypothetical protein
MATEWFIYREDGRHGPFSSAEIRSLARNGGLQPSDRLWKEGMRKTRRAGKSVKLFPAATRQVRPATSQGQGESDFGFGFDDPQVARPIILIVGAAALLLAIVGLVVSFWPVGDVAEIPPPATRPRVVDATHAQVAEADAAAPAAEPAPAADPSPQRSPSVPGVPDDF